MSKIKEIFKKFSKELILSIIVSVVTAFICNGYEWLVKIIPKAGETFSMAAKNIIVSRAAEISQFSVLKVFLDFSTLVIINAFLCIIFVSIINFSIKPKLDDLDIKQFKQLITVMKKQNISCNNDEGIEEKANLTSEYREVSKLSKQIKIHKNMCIVFYIMCILFVVYFAVYTFFFIITPLELWNDFETSVTAIAPYISEEEEEELRAEWIFMKSEKDFDEIYEYIDEIGYENDIVRFKWSLVGVLLSDNKEVTP